MIFTFFLLILPSVASLKYLIVSTSYGEVRGYEYQSKSGFVAEIFKKIPYAAPPTGKRRWKKPIPPDKWNGTLDGTFFGPACAQIPLTWKGYVTGLSENCLTLNVYTSKTCRQSKNCQVILYIHGGAALFSGVTMFPDEMLVTNYAKQEVILVTVSYRVGVFGVMALGDEHALPANLAVHDILESLRFVRKEIHNFGGDKNQITIMGHSTGATIVGTLVFSPYVNRAGEMPLFARAIGLSTAMNFEQEEKQVNVSHAVAAKLGCTGTAREIIECMRPLGTSKILQAASAIGGSDLFSLTQLSGIILAGELFPIRNMRELRDNQLEHMNQLAPMQPTKLLLGSQLNEFRHPGQRMGTGPEYKYRVTDVLGVLNSNECVEKYNNDRQTGAFGTDYDTVSQAILMTTSLFGRAQADAGGEVYLYQFDYPAHAMHADDLFYIMGTQEHPMDENEQWLSRVYPVYFTNFARGLAPAPDWTPLDPQLMNYYSINKSFTDGIVPKMKIGYHQDLTDYYEEMMIFDENLSKNQAVLIAPVEYKELTVPADNPFSLCDIIICSAVFGVLLFIMFLLCQCYRNNRNSGELIPLKATR